MTSDSIGEDDGNCEPREYCMPLTGKFRRFCLTEKNVKYLTMSMYNLKAMVI